MRSAIDTMLEHDENHATDVKLVQQALDLPSRDEDDGMGIGDFDREGITNHERDAFEDILAIITERRSVLTQKQRAWVRGVLARNDVVDESDINLVSRGLVPRGPEVETPAVLRNLPKEPPGGKRFGR